MSLGAKIRTARKTAGLTQSEFSVALNVNRATVSKYEGEQIVLSVPRLR